jgi:Mycobacterium membrane protein
MNRPYTAHSPYSLTPTERIRSPYEEAPDLDEFEGLEEYDYDDEDYDYYEPIDRRWVWVAAVAGAILLVAVICTVVILGGGDSGSVSTTIAPATTTTRPAATTSAPPAATTPSTPPPVATLPPETVTTVAPTESAPPSAAPTEAAPSPRTVTYTVTGNRQLIDLVSVIYTDQQGALQTEFNVALPWSKTVVLDPGVELSSVTATSVAGQLNCSITDAAGGVIAQQNSNTMIATCTK